jgi:ABC-type polysaccharide/polyol phosphate transport system ATPase subunit
MTTGPASVAVRATGLSKTFHVYLKPVDVLRDLFSRTSRAIERQALSDLSFEVRRGEVVGILGRNGAGKSTLLKIIAGTLDRTAGDLEINGRITAILELGTGFHPDYSGRENIRLGGLCLGMKSEEIERKTEGIIEFSELRDVIDQPFRTYSTGMQARLTFATAISVDPDILIIDEALSVGDARFQMKCFARMAELRQQGRTLLLVSHDTNTITTFCDRAIVLEGGRLFAQGNAREMSAAYLRLLFGEQQAPLEPVTSPVEIPPAPPAIEALPAAATGQTTPAAHVDTSAAAAPEEQGPVDALDVAAAATPPVEPPPGRHTRFGDGAMRVVSYGLVDASGRETRVLVSGGRYRFHMRGRCVRQIDRVSCGFAIKDRRGTVLFGVTNIARGEPIDAVRPGEVVDISTELTMWLAAGEYFMNLGFGYLANGEMCDFLEDGIQFTVHGPGGIFTTAVVNLEADFRINREAPVVTTASANS